MSKKQQVAGTIGAVIAVAAMFLAVLASAPDAAAQDAKPTLAITQIDLDSGTIKITNHGTSEADPNGIVLCNFPDYAPIAGASMIAPGASITVDATTTGVPMNAAHGEMGLYLTSSFEDPTQLISYVEYGEGGHKRAPVAIAAGIWSAGFAPGGGGVLNASSNNPTSPGAWASATTGSSASGTTGSSATTELAVTGTNPSLILLGSAAVVCGLGLVGVSRRRMATLG